MKGLFVTLFLTLVCVIIINNQQYTSTDLVEFNSGRYTCHYRTLSCMFQTGNCGINCQHGTGLTLKNQTSCFPINDLILVGFN